MLMDPSLRFRDRTANKLKAHHTLKHMISCSVYIKLCMGFLLMISTSEAARLKKRVEDIQHIQVTSDSDKFIASLQFDESNEYKSSLQSDKGHKNRRAQSEKESGHMSSLKSHENNERISSLHSEGNNDITSFLQPNQSNEHTTRLHKNIVETSYSKSGADNEHTRTLQEDTVKTSSSRTGVGNEHTTSLHENTIGTSSSRRGADNKHASSIQPEENEYTLRLRRRANGDNTPQAEQKTEQASSSQPGENNEQTSRSRGYEKGTDAVIILEKLDRAVHPRVARRSPKKRNANGGKIFNTAAGPQKNLRVNTNQQQVTFPSPVAVNENPLNEPQVLKNKELLSRVQNIPDFLKARNGTEKSNMSNTALNSTLPENMNQQFREKGSFGSMNPVVVIDVEPHSNNSFTSYHKRTDFRSRWNADDGFGKAGFPVNNPEQVSRSADKQYLPEMLNQKSKFFFLRNAQNGYNEDNAGLKHETDGQNFGYYNRQNAFKIGSKSLNGRSSPDSLQFPIQLIKMLEQSPKNFPYETNIANSGNIGSREINSRSRYFLDNDMLPMNNLPVNSEMKIYQKENKSKAFNKPVLSKTMAKNPSGIHFKTKYYDSSKIHNPSLNMEEGLGSFQMQNLYSPGKANLFQKNIKGYKFYKPDGSLTENKKTQLQQGTVNEQKGWVPNEIYETRRKNIPVFQKQFVTNKKVMNLPASSNKLPQFQVYYIKMKRPDGYSPPQNNGFQLKSKSFNKGLKLSDIKPHNVSINSNIHHINDNVNKYAEKMHIKGPPIKTVDFIRPELIESIGKGKIRSANPHIQSNIKINKNPMKMENFSSLKTTNEKENPKATLGTNEKENFYGNRIANSFGGRKFYRKIKSDNQKIHVYEIKNNISGLNSLLNNSNQNTSATQKNNTTKDEKGKLLKQDEFLKGESRVGSSKMFKGKMQPVKIRDVDENEQTQILETDEEKDSSNNLLNNLLETNDDFTDVYLSEQITPFGTNNEIPTDIIPDIESQDNDNSQEYYVENPTEQSEFINNNMEDMEVSLPSANFDYEQDLAGESPDASGEVIMTLPSVNNKQGVVLLDQNQRLLHLNGKNENSNISPIQLNGNEENKPSFVEKENIQGLLTQFPEQEDFKTPGVDDLDMNGVGPMHILNSPPQEGSLLDEVQNPLAELVSVNENLFSSTNEIPEISLTGEEKNTIISGEENIKGEQKPLPPLETLKSEMGFGNDDYNYVQEIQQTIQPNVKEENVILQEQIQNLPSDSHLVKEKVKTYNTTVIQLGDKEKIPDFTGKEEGDVIQIQKQIQSNQLGPKADTTITSNIKSEEIIKILQPNKEVLGDILQEQKQNNPVAYPVEEQIQNYVEEMPMIKPYENKEQNPIVTINEESNMLPIPSQLPSFETLENQINAGDASNGKVFQVLPPDNEVQNIILEDQKQKIPEVYPFKEEIVNVNKVPVAEFNYNDQNPILVGKESNLQQLQKLLSPLETVDVNVGANYQKTQSSHSVSEDEGVKRIETNYVNKKTETDTLHIEEKIPLKSDENYKNFLQDTNKLQGKCTTVNADRPVQTSLMQLLSPENPTPSYGIGKFDKQTSEKDNTLDKIYNEFQKDLNEMKPYAEHQIDSNAALVTESPFNELNIVKELSDTFHTVDLPIPLKGINSVNNIEKAITTIETDLLNLEMTTLNTQEFLPDEIKPVSNSPKMIKISEKKFEIISHSNQKNQLDQLSKLEQMFQDDKSIEHKIQNELISKKRRVKRAPNANSNIYGAFNSTLETELEDRQHSKTNNITGIELLSTSWQDFQYKSHLRKLQAPLTLSKSKTKLTTLRSLLLQTMVKSFKTNTTETKSETNAQVKAKIRKNIRSKGMILVWENSTMHPTNSFLNRSKSLPDFLRNFSLHQLVTETTRNLKPTFYKDVNKTGFPLLHFTSKIWGYRPKHYILITILIVLLLVYFITEFYTSIVIFSKDWDILQFCNSMKIQTSKKGIFTCTSSEDKENQSIMRRLICKLSEVCSLRNNRNESRF